MKSVLVYVICLLFSTASWSLEIEGVVVPDSVTVASKKLQLNGAGVRTKFFFDIYVGALYLPEKTTTAVDALAMTGPKQLTMTFLYKEVAQKKLVAAWDEGFRLNHSAADMAVLKDRLMQFNNLFVTAHKGDIYEFSFLADGSTVVVLNGSEAGVITGVDFQRALLAVWLGDVPADNGLKAAMLGG